MPARTPGRGRGVVNTTAPTHPNGPLAAEASSATSSPTTSAPPLCSCSTRSTPARQPTQSLEARPAPGGYPLPPGVGRYGP